MGKTMRKTVALIAALTLCFPAFALSATGSSAVVQITGQQSQDSDGDGLADVVEIAAGTNPNSVDTDGNGMDDAYEIYTGLNPNDPSDANQDLDHDGLTNAQEAALNTLPYEMDSDGDGWSDAIEVERGTSPTSADDHPQPTKLGDVDADGTVSAADIQYVINGALGVETAVPANVNGVNGVDSIDVQLVINAALAG